MISCQYLLRNVIYYHQLFGQFFTIFVSSSVVYGGLQLVPMYVLGWVAKELVVQALGLVRIYEMQRYRE